MKKRILSLILAVVFIFLMIPLFTLPIAAAESVKVKTADELREALRKDGDMVIELTADITNYKLPNDFKWDGYDASYDYFYWATVGKGTKKLYLLGHSVNIDDDFVTTAEYKNVKEYVTETGKTSENVKLIKGIYIQKAALLRIQYGTSLTIYGKNGGMSMTAQMPSSDQTYDNQIVMQRDVFFVTGGSLDIQGGTYQAGRRKDKYVSRAEIYVNNEQNHKLTLDNSRELTGYGEYVINGEALRMYSGNVTINGGIFKGHGYSYIGNPLTFYSDYYRNSTIGAFGGKLSIRDAIVTGYSGANAISITKDYCDVDIYSGEFSSEASKKLLWPNTYTSKLFGYNGVYSKYQAIDVKSGNTSIKNATTHDGTTIQSFDNKTIVYPAESGFTGGSLSWSDGTSDEKKISLGSHERVYFTPPETYFPKDALDGGQKINYYVSLMYQTSDGKWKNVGESWVETEKSFVLENLTNNWMTGTKYRLKMKTVENWVSENHSYTITKKTATSLYFTIVKNKTIDKIVIDGFDPQKRTLTYDMLTSSTQGVDKVASTWNKNGEYIAGTISATAGKYYASVQIFAKEGYTFTKNTVVDFNGVSEKPYIVSYDGKKLQVCTPEIIRECDHENSNEPWQENGYIHFRKCPICDTIFDVAEHNFTKTSTSGKTTTYTCTICGYQKEVIDNREAIKALLIDMKALVVGDKLAVPTLASEFNNKATLVSYNWYKGKGTTNAVSVGTIAEKGWYTLKVTLNAENGYFFPNGAFVTHAHGTEAGSNVEETTIVGTMYVYCYEEADGKVVIPALTPNKTLGDILKETSVLRSGDSRINVNYYVKYEGNSYIIKRTFDGKWSIMGGTETIDQVLAKKIVPNTEYEIEFEFSAGSYYINPEKISVESKSYMIGYTTDSSEAWGNAKATIISETNVINLIEISNVRMPVAGEIPNIGYNIDNDSIIRPILAYWNETQKYVCGKSYVFTLEVKAEDGYRFILDTIATVNGIEADFIYGDNVSKIVFESEKIEHSFSDWVNKIEPKCETEGIAERTCSVCGVVENMSLPAEGHTFIEFNKIEATCVNYGMAEHYECQECGKYFDLSFKEKPKSTFELPIDTHNHVGGEISIDENSHFTLCACGEKLNIESHKFGDWNVSMEPQPGLEGIKEKECEVCGYIHSEKIDALPGTHTHSYNEKYDETYHWKECACGDVIDKEEHKFGKDGVCSVCGAKKAENVESTTSSPTQSGETQKPGEQGKGSLVWLWILIGVIVIVVIVVIILVSKKKKQDVAKQEQT